MQRIQGFEEFKDSNNLRMLHSLNLSVERMHRFKKFIA